MLGGDEMLSWKQGIGLYVALIIGGLASMHTHFVEYIVILLVALGYTGFVLYDENKQLYKYQIKEEDKLRTEKSKIAKQIVKDIEDDYYHITDDFEGIEIPLDKWQSFKAKFEE